jgi:CHASE3 domain sensor protein
MTTETIQAKIRLLEAAALRNLDAMDQAMEAREAANEEAAKEASKDFHAALCNHLRAVDAARELRLRLAAVEG